MQKVAKNTFNRALNTYTDEQHLEPSYYTEAHNITLVSEGKFFSPTNIQGTEFLADVVADITTLVDANIKTVACKFKIGTTEDVPVLVQFITGKEAGDYGAVYITAYDTANNILYYLYRETGISTDYFDDHRIVDARLFPENGIDYIYFTDGYHELRQLRCEIPTGSLDYFLTDYDLSLQRRGATGTALNTFTSFGAGSLLSGTYQFAYRMVDPDNKKFTKWSSLSNPTHVYSAADSSSPVYSAVGLATNAGITVSITPSTEELNHFDYFQLAVIENIYPVASSQQPASLLPVTAFGAGTYQFNSNRKIGIVPIEEIVVDLAAIKTAKTLAIKQDRLFAGNVKYQGLEFESDPIAVGSFKVQNVSASDSNGIKLGYFRDEVYRFGIIYKDKYGNRSPVKVLDLNAISGNAIKSPLPDVRFPGRSTSSSYSLMSSGNVPRTLGLTLGVRNHPSWAVGFEIVRAKRIKRILFQTPLIGVTSIEGIGALDSYPSLATTDTTAPTTTAYPDAQPQSTTKVYSPENLFWPDFRIINRRDTAVGAGTGRAKIGEAQLSRTSVIPSYSIIFPPASMFNTGAPYQFGTDKVEVVDYALTKVYVKDFETGAHAEGGEHIKTKLSGTWFALNNGDYFFDSAWVGKALTETAQIGIKNYTFVDSLNSGVLIGGNNFFKYSSLSGTGVNWGYEQQTQRCAVIETSQALAPLNQVGSTTFASGVYNSRGLSGTPYIVGAAGPQYQDFNLFTNKFINEYSGFTNNSSYVRAFRIANVVNGEKPASDDRYGTVETNHEFISTGTSYTFSSGEIDLLEAGTDVYVTNLDVFGGDCFVAAHTYKVADTSYSVVQQGKNDTPQTIDSATTLLSKWDNRYYLNSAGAAISQPVALAGASQLIEVVLESEYNGEVLAQDVTSGVTTVNGIPVLGLNSDSAFESVLRSPLLYEYNINLSKHNDQKVYQTLSTINFVQNDFKARVICSDVKIYGSDVQGFDVFRVGNIFDLEENKGALTKLGVCSDDLYAIQETGITYLPTGQSQLQQTDAGILAVGTGDVIGRPIVVHQLRGSQHIRGIVETGECIYVPDAKNQNVYKLQGRQLTHIYAASDIFAKPIAESDVVGFYDPLNSEFFLADNENNTCFVFNEFIEGGTWIGDYEFNLASTKLADGLYGHNKLYVTAQGVTDSKVTYNTYTMYEGDHNSLFGHTVVPRVKLVVNPESDIAKTFDNMLLVSTDRLDEVNLTVPRESMLGDQTSTVSLDNLSIEGGFRIKTMRDADGARLRGSRMTAQVKWKTGADDVATLSSILTKYRPSSRTPF